MLTSIRSGNQQRQSTEGWEKHHACKKFHCGNPQKFHKEDLWQTQLDQSDICWSNKLKNSTGSGIHRQNTSYTNSFTFTLNNMHVNKCGN